MLATQESAGPTPCRGEQLGLLMVSPTDLQLIVLVTLLMVLAFVGLLLVAS
jgi:hypothetical protein